MLLDTITINDFKVRSEVKSLLEMYGIESKIEIITILEQYKFMDRGELLHCLNSNLELPSDTKILKDDNEDNNENRQLIRHVEPGSIGSHSEKFKELEERFGVYVTEKENGSVIVLNSIENDSLDILALELLMNIPSMKLIWVTPYNYSILRGITPEINHAILFRRILLEAIDKKATDLHITVAHINKEAKYKIYYRQDGILCEMHLFDLTAQDNQILITNLISTSSNRHDIDLLTSAGVTALIPNVFGDSSVELRVSANRVKDGFECVCRIQNTKTVSLTISELGFPEHTQEVLIKVSKKRAGLTLFTGPIRTGKNTSAFALANEMIKSPVKIKSFESPIEALMPFPQVDFNGEPAQLSDAVRLAKKQDLNIAFINEIPDKTVAFGVQDLVNSSVHVVTTLHINRLWHLPYKLSEYYGEGYKNVISQINAIFNQKMFGCLCEKCKEEMLTANISDSDIRNLLLERGINKIYTNKGCTSCINIDSKTIGIQRGRNQPYVEYLLFTEELKSKLVSCNSPYEMENLLKNELRATEHTLEKEMCEAVAHGIISYEALYSLL